MAAPELSIDSFIGSDGWFSGITASYVNRWLRENGKASEITVRLNTPGGDVFEGMAIYTALKRASARVVMEVEGLAASAGSVILMAGDERRIHKGAMVMVHEGWAVTLGPREDHQKTADLLAKINGEMSALYAERTGQTVEKCAELMAANETWLTAEESVALGFCDTVIPAKGLARQSRSKASAQMLSRYKNAPAAALSMLGAEPTDDAEAAPTARRSEPSRLVQATRHLSDFLPRASAHRGQR